MLNPIEMMADSERVCVYGRKVNKLLTQVSSCLSFDRDLKLCTVSQWLSMTYESISVSHYADTVKSDRTISSW